MRFLCAVLAIVMFAAVASRADETPAADHALGDLVIQGLDQPLRLRVYAIHDNVPWNEYSTVAREQQLQLLFQQLDTDANGKLALEEARRMPRPETLGRTGRLPGVNVAFNYRVLDVDGDGGASMDELRAYLEEYSQPGPTVGFVAVQTERNPGDLFPALDADRNRRLSAEEWSAVPQLLERDRDGNRVLTPDELRTPSAELFGPEFVALPISQAAAAGAEAPLVATLEPVNSEMPDGTLWLRVSDAGPIAPPVIEVELNDRAKELGVTIETDAAQRVRLRMGRRFLVVGTLQSGLRGNAAVSSALLRQFDALAESLGRPVTLKDNVPVELKAAFSVADANGDGNLERAELEKCIAGYVEATASSTASRLTIMFVPERRGLSPLIDENRDSRLGMREIQRLTAQMAALANEDGTIGLNEVPSVASVVFCLGVAPDAVDPSLLANSGPAWFVRADLNSDGDLDAAEFIGPPEVFARLDANGDGWVELAEALRVNEAELVPSAKVKP
jgi:Ca2+-binding EF-hand superfamily protein